MRTSEQIDDFIRAKHAEGSRPGDIGQQVGLTAVETRQRMAVLGLEVDEASTEAKYHVHAMWNANSDERREAIWKRQHDGARATRKENRK